jgi:hypothetical protein
MDVAVKEIVMAKGLDRWSRHGAQLGCSSDFAMREKFWACADAGPQFRTPEIGDTPREVSQ